MYYRYDVRNGGLDMSPKGHPSNLLLDRGHQGINLRITSRITRTTTARMMARSIAYFGSLIHSRTLSMMMVTSNAWASLRQSGSCVCSDGLALTMVCHVSWLRNEGRWPI